MAQSNYAIPNDSAPAVRAQMNAVFASIATNNSGAAEPTTTFAYQWWYDTTANTLKMRNGADSGWIDIALFDQTGGTFQILTEFASQAEAEAGTDNTKAMTPLRTAQALAAQASGWTLVSDSTTWTGEQQTVTGLGGYSEILVTGVAVTITATLGNIARLLRVGGSAGIISTSSYLHASGTSTGWQISDSSNSARSFSTHIFNFNTTDPIKPAISNNALGQTIIGVDTATVLDRVQVLPSGAGATAVSGRLLVWGKT
jgi:hypothetical protein